MPKALIDMDRCRPELCTGGICAGRGVCDVKAIRQEGPGEAPWFDWSRCRACSKCVAVCPAKAISFVR